MTRAWACLSAIASLLIAAPASAADWYVDPRSGSPSGDGSMGNPWRTLEEVVAAGLIETRHYSPLPYSASSTLMPVNAGAPIQPGDTIWLASGFHGALSIQGAHNAMPITIAAMPGATPQLSHVVFSAASEWVLRGVSISPSYATPYVRQTALEIEDHGHHGPSHDITVERCDVFAVPDIASFSAADWNDQVGNGISVGSDDCIIRDDTVRNINFGIQASGQRDLIQRNLVENFAGDGLRGLGDYDVFEHNTVRNCFAVNDNHDDGFQSWSVGPGGVGTGEVVGIVLRGNTIINYTDEAQPLRGTLQGIGCFDGFFTDWVIENNVIITDHWHGITLLGARGSRIVNNTVIDPNDERPGPTWISIDDHKDGSPSTDCVVRNNLSMDIQVPDRPTVTVDHNVLVDDPARFFVDAPGYDLHLLADAPAIDVGVDTLAPMFDFDGIARPQLGGYDVGAYEWHEPSVVPADAGMPPIGTDGGPSVGRDGGLSGFRDGGIGGPMDGGCGCRAAPRSSRTPLALVLGLLAAVLVRRRG
ncbi:MAG: choice-of-anchor Q domain-containing protein [Sandaracinaceae bacterium]